MWNTRDHMCFACDFGTDDVESAQLKIILTQILKDVVMYNQRSVVQQLVVNLYWNSN